MGTFFEEIYQRAIFKFKDYAFLNFSPDIKDAVFQNHLLSAIADFSRASIIPLTYSRIEEDAEKPEESGEESKPDKYAFDNSLGIEEIEILALGIAFHWLSGQVLNSELLRNVMHNKDYKSYSPANLLKEMQSLRDYIKTEFIGRINIYSFRNSNLQNMRP